MPQTSIILPCYNVENYLPRAIESVLNQTNPDFELLVVIDGSPDNSKTIAEKYALNDNRIKVFEKPNGGLSDARNYGLERAKGEFVYFMDSDDWIEPNLLEDNLKIIQDENLDFIIFGYIQDDEDADGNLMASKVVAPKISELIKGQPIELDVHHIGLMGYAWNKVYRRSFLNQHNFRFEKGISLVEDILFNAPIYTISQKIVFNPKTYYHYLNRPVVTLMKTFHENSFELKVKKNLALDKFLSTWSVSNKKKLLADSLFLGLKYSILNLVDSNTEQSDKYKYLKELCSHPRVEKILTNYSPRLLKDKILLFLIHTKSVKTINLLIKLR